MKIALVQYTASEDPAQNIQRGLKAVEEAAKKGARLVVFPELAFTRFFPQHRLDGDRLDMAEEIPGPTTRAFSGLADRLGVVVVLNLFERKGDRAYDSSPVIDADGRILGCARMVHITQYECFFEQDYYDPGDAGAPVFDTAVGKLGVAICYDRHYPEYLRALALAGAEIVVIPQAGAEDEWPQGVFEAELQAGAFQNGYFMALANRIGPEDRLTFAGGSVIVDPMGQILKHAPLGKETILYADLDLSLVPKSPARRLFLRHRRPEIYEAGAVQATQGRNASILSQIVRE